MSDPCTFAPLCVATVDESVLAWLMSHQPPDLDPLVAELVNRPAWHQDAACRLQTALANPETTGVWAGTTARGRRAMRRAESAQVIPVRRKRRLAR